MARAYDSNPDQEQLLLESFLKGQPHAYDTVEAWVGMTIRSARMAIPPDEQADLAQEALTDILVAAGREGFQLNRSFRGFVRKIAVARCIDWIRKRRIVIPLWDDFPGTGDDPLEQLSHKERGHRLRLAVMDLSEPCRKLIGQRFYERLSYREIAQFVNGTNEGTLRVRLHECLKRLRRIAADIV